jgi:hypothetical protein
VPQEESVRVLLAAGAIVICTGAAAAGPEVAPQHGVIQSDIARGIDAAAKCESQSWSIEDYSGCVDGEIGHAMDKDQASLPFQFGVYCAAFSKLALAYSTGKWKQSLIDRDDAQVATVDQYGSCVYLARSLGIVRPQICTTLGVSCDAFNAALRHWRQVSRRDM